MYPQTGYSAYPSSFQYYAPPPPPPPPPPGPTSFVSKQSSKVQPPLPPPPPPPPPGTSPKKGIPKAEASVPAAIPTGPLQPPPMPPPFPWLNPDLAASLSAGEAEYGGGKEKEVLPFVPVVITTADLNKMTETIKQEADDVKGKNLLLYEDIIDNKLPKQLKEMFQPLYCKLCTLTVSNFSILFRKKCGFTYSKSLWVFNFCS